MKIKIISFFILLISIFSCNLINDTPDQVFHIIGLSANKIPSSFQRIFREFREHKANGTLKLPSEDGKTMKRASCEEVVKFAYANIFKQDIKRIKDLHPTKDAEPIVKAGIELFEYADEIQTRDFLMIAKMIDQGKSDEEIDIAVKHLDDTKGAELDQRFGKVMDLLLPYADANGVEYNKI